MIGLIALVAFIASFNIPTEQPRAGPPDPSDRDAIDDRAAARVVPTSTG